MKKVGVLVVDDHPLMRRGMKVLLDSTDDVEMVGEAGTAEEALDLVKSLAPDVVVMDLRMPGMGGIEGIRSIRAVAPATRVLVVTLFADDDSLFQTLRAGATGYVLKESAEDEVLGAIRAVAAGDAIFGASIARRVLDFFASPGARRGSEPFPELTQREREILALVAQGRSNTEIANALYLSLKTVRNYISTIFSKLQVADRAQAIVRAREAGLR